MLNAFRQKTKMSRMFTAWMWSLGIVARSYRVVVLLAALIARWTSGLIMPEPIYHVLALNWRRPLQRHPLQDGSAAQEA